LLPDFCHACVTVESLRNNFQSLFFQSMSCLVWMRYYGVKFVDDFVFLNRFNQEFWF
jgi:hypothetical protein